MQQQCSGVGPVPAWSCSSYSRRDSQSGSAHRHGSSDGCGGNGLSGRPFHKGRTCSVSDHEFAYGCARTCSWCKACYRSRICNKSSPVWLGIIQHLLKKKILAKSLKHTWSLQFCVWACGWARNWRACKRSCTGRRHTASHLTPYHLLPLLLPLRRRGTPGTEWSRTVTLKIDLKLRGLQRMKGADCTS